MSTLPMSTAGSTPFTSVLSKSLNAYVQNLACQILCLLNRHMMNLHYFAYEICLMLSYEENDVLE